MNKTYEEVGNGKICGGPTVIALQYRRGWILHREAAPAIILYRKTGKIFQKGWFLRGLRHRSGGPAVQAGLWRSWHLHGRFQAGTKKLRGLDE